MSDDVVAHYRGASDLADRIRRRLAEAGKDLERITTRDLATIDEFHIRGRHATLELAERMGLTPSSRVLDIGSGLGGPARTLAEVYGCEVVGIDLTPAFCDAANRISEWLGLADRVRCMPGDAADPPFDPASFDAAMTIHVGMNVPDKHAFYTGAKRSLRPGAIFAVYDVLQGEGGPVEFPVPWARDASISHLATPGEMRQHLTQAGFRIEDEIDSTEVSHGWFEAMAARMAVSGPPPVGFHLFLGAEFADMARNQVKNLAERRIRTVTYICRA
ncbi:MAG TPA: class I SAM-dependent methyltransferase [Arenicellales bacterium]|nr:class I SAM-dependent methyltransferase [Arenicellales bacterium]